MESSPCLVCSVNLPFIKTLRRVYFQFVHTEQLILSIVNNSNNPVFFVFFFNHNKMHSLTNYKAFKNKSNKTRQDNTGHEIYIRHTA